MSGTSSSVKDPFEYHVARVLLLVVAFSPTARSKLDGLTKIAKLDFLLRYPVYLERLFELRETPLPPELRPSLNERQGLESAMIRYKYGPWDDRYYPVIGRLIGQALAEPVPGKGAVALRATTAGKDLAARLGEEDWSVVLGRAEALKSHLDLSGSTLKQLIYESFPDVIDRPLRSLIDEVPA
ncbi:MAG TPA: hypothetical protein VFR75_00460 [Solirubrobacterales bacterium]|nr:hypothetical protein [Solirubrobacterales bacterium]